MKKIYIFIAKAGGELERGGNFCGDGGELLTLDEFIRPRYLVVVALF